MSYTDLRFKGTLESIDGSYVVTSGNQGLVFPDILRVTYISLRRDSGGKEITEVFGELPEDSVGKPIEFIQSYYELDQRRDLFMHEFYIDGRRVVNQATVRQR